MTNIRHEPKKRKNILSPVRDTLLSLAGLFSLALFSRLTSLSLLSLLLTLLLTLCSRSLCSRSLCTRSLPGRRLLSSLLSLSLIITILIKHILQRLSTQRHRVHKQVMNASHTSDQAEEVLALGAGNVFLIVKNFMNRLT